MRRNPQETADLVTFTEEILDGKLHFLCSGILENNYRPKKECYKRPIWRSTNWNIFLWDRLDKRESLYTRNFIKKCQKSFLYSKWTNWNTITCKTSTKKEICKFNGSFCFFYPNLPKNFLYIQNEQR